MGIAAVRIDHPFLAPVCRQFDRAFADGDDLQAEPLVERAARQQLLDVFNARNFTHLAATLSIAHRRLRHDHDLADDLAILDEAQSFGGLLERQHLVDYRLDLLLRDHLHEIGEIVLIEAVGTDDLEFEAPDIAEIFLGIMSGGRAAHQKASAALEATQRRDPGVAAGEIDDDIDAALIGAALRLRSEEHTSELQSRPHLVCRLLLEKKKKN